MKINRRELNRFLLWALGSGALAGCKGADKAPPTISIQSTKPSGEVPLLVGEHVRFEVGVLARNASQPSSAAIVAQAADGTLLCTAGPEILPADQIKQFILDVQIPSTTSVNIFAALYADPNKDSVAVDQRVFKIVGVAAK